MSYRTNTFAHTPLRVSTSDAPYGLQLEIAFTAFNDRIRPQSLPQHLTIDARVTLFTQEEATATVAELRSMADAIEAYAPKLKEK